MNDEDIKYISRCIELAKKGIGMAAPNPMVGCVIVCGGEIIGEGFHKEFGGPHAEVNAINSVSDKNNLKKSTIYINLEPCSHFGKTPPCADLIISMGIPKVVIGMIDPFKEVSGKGIKKLKNAGIEVVSGVMEKECREINKRFITFHEKRRPYIILKWAQTSDGYIGLKKEEYINGRLPVWVINEKLKTIVHKWRTEEQSIMVGTNTALLDNPMLNAREWKGKSPLRIALDRNLRLPDTLNLFDNKIPTIIFTSKKNTRKKSTNLEYILIDFEKNILKQICNILFERKITSLFVEGGTRLLQTFIDEGLWDEARIFSSEKKIIRGVKAPVIIGNVVSEKKFRYDKLVILQND